MTTVRLKPDTTSGHYVGRIRTLRTEQMLGERRVVVNRAVQIGDFHVLVVGVGDVNRAGTIQQRRAPIGEKGNIRRIGKRRRVEPGTVGMVTGGTSRISSMVTSGVNCVITARSASTSATVRNITSASASAGTTFGATPPLIRPTV